MLKTFKIALDLEAQTAFNVFSVSQGDLNSIFVTLELTQDGQPVNLTNSTVRLVIKKPSGLTLFKDCIITNAIQGVCTIMLDTQATAELGNYISELYVYEDDTVVVTGTFTYSSRSTILNDSTVVSSNEWQSINTKLNEAQTKLDESQAMLDDLRLNGIDSVARADIDKVSSSIVLISEYGTLNGDGVTSDQTVIANAVADCKLKGYSLNWGNDNKTYLTTASIPDFHKVKHIGNAIIKRGTDLFYISPIGTQRNKIYVASTGASNTFDGLSLGQPVARVQTAFDWIANYTPVLTGYWEVVLTSGTFPNRAVLKDGLLSENPIEVSGVSVGGHPNVPTSIISEGVGASAVGILATGGSKIKANNIKFTGFNGSTSSAGMKVANSAELETSNCHFTDCYWGVSSEGRTKVTVPDGIQDNCGYLNGGGGTGAGIRSLQLSNHVIGIQNAGSQVNTVIFKNCYQALLLQESSTGHVDWCTIQDCVSGIVIRVNARANVDGTSFKRNGADIRRDSPSHVYVTSNTVFGTGADESTNKVVMTDGAITNSTMISGVELSTSTNEKAFAMQYLNQTVNSLSLLTVYTATLKAPFWRGTPTSITPMKKLYFRVFGTLNGTANNKKVNVRLGASLVGVTYGATETGAFSMDGYIYFTGADAQFLFLSSERHLGTSTRKSRAVGSNVMTSDVNLSVEASVDNATDSVVIEMIEVGWA